MVAMCLLSSSSWLWSQTVPHINFSSSVLIPKDVFVGDTAELRCTLETQLLLMPEEVDFQQVTLETKYEDSDFTVVRLELKKIEQGYNLSIFFIPWRTGSISLPEIDIGIFPAVKEIMKDQLPMKIALPSVAVESLTERLKTVELRPAAAPLLLPGSIYVVYVFIALGLVLFILLIIVCLRYKKVSILWREWRTKIRMSKNYRKTLKKLKKLSRLNISDKIFAEELERVLRRYLEKRFAMPFYSATSLEIQELFDKNFEDLLSSEQQSAIDRLCDIFRRCDYVRYSLEGKFELEEAKRLIDVAIEVISVFEARDS